MRKITAYLFVVSLVMGMGCQETENNGRRDGVLSEANRRKAENARQSFTLHEGLELQQFAAEPMLINPTNLDIDERGRIWVCEAQNYRSFRNDHPIREAGDRILILEDTDGDGKADHQKTFYQGTDVNSALGIAKLGNKIYVAASPSLLVFTDENGDDIPDQKDTLFTGLEGVDHDHGVHAVIFGPDGKLYFNYGNEGKRLRLKSGELAKDKRGETIEEGKIFRQGMIFRCNADGTDLEIMGHNFRNNYELAVDAYGAMWQSDNDDDGNQGTRINFVMDYGNYGFTDQVTGAGWRNPRIGMHEEIPKRHWHLNDPGVVPNLLQTGAGSPTGILVYEGDALPEVFHGQMIHCEPGKNVVRSYPVQPAGSGYSANIVPLVTSSDAWFRPSDVCAAPDGSIMISDWYDAGVGGHLMADIERGRIYRVYKSGKEKYQPTMPDLAMATSAAIHLNHVNQATRYLAYQKVIGDPNAHQVLLDLIGSTKDMRLRAKAYWCLASLKDQAKVATDMAIKELDHNLRMAAIRMGRQFLTKDAQIDLIAEAVQDNDPGVLREAALSLRFLSGPRANEFWNTLANKYDGKDRWYLEALGIGSDLHADERLTSYLAAMQKKDLRTSSDIIWRLRSDRVLPHLYELIQEAKSAEEMVRYFRAMHFLSPEKTETYIAKALQENNHRNQKEMVRFALGSISPEVLQKNKSIQKRVKQVLPDLRGTDTWPMVVRNAQLKEEAPILLDSALVSTNESFRNEAVGLAASLGGQQLINQLFDTGSNKKKLAVLDLASYLNNKENQEWLTHLFEDPNQEEIIRHRAAKSLTNNWSSMAMLTDRLEGGELNDKDAEIISTFLSQAWRSDVRQRAIAWITSKKGAPPIDLEGLSQKEGDVTKGKTVFDQFCQGCHQVNGNGLNFGPNLSLIGDKLGKDALLSAIVYPSMGIGFGYEGFEIETSDGQRFNGFVESETEDQITVRMMGGVSQEIEKSEIVKKQLLAASLMTANLHQLMEEGDLVDLIEFLAALKKSETM